MSFFQKLKDQAKQVAKRVSMAAETFTETVSDFSVVASEVLMNTQAPPPKKAQDELLDLFFEACQIMDEGAQRDDADSSEADRLLYNSNVKSNLKKVTQLLQTESDTWLSKYSQRPDPEISEMPCLDTFLQTQVLQELVNRAVRDLPRGCLPLILGQIAILLRNVKYPLLPHQTVHKPIARLISVASRFDALNTSNSSASLTSRQELASYKKRIDIGLTNLIGTVWRKISENPPVLNYFTLQDRSGRSSRSLQPQMDIMTALTILMSKPKVGPFAKEALLVAVNMHDVRVETFIVNHTNLLQTVVSEVKFRFQNALEFLAGAPVPIPLSIGVSAANATTSSSSGGSSKSGRSGNGPSTPSGDVGSKLPTLGAGILTPPLSSRNAASTTAPPGSATLVGDASGSSLGASVLGMAGVGGSPTYSSKRALTPRQAEARLGPVEAFVRAVRFCDALITAATWTSDPGVSNSLGGSFASATEDVDSVRAYATDLRTSTVDPRSPRPTDPEGGAEPSSPISPRTLYHEQPMFVRSEVVREFESTFLASVLRPALMCPGEGHAVAAQSLTGRLVAEVASGSKDGHLLHKITSFLCTAPGRDTARPWVEEVEDGAGVSAGSVGDVGVGLEALLYGGISRAGSGGGAEISIVKCLVSRSMSVAKALSMSSIQLLTQLLALAPLDHALALLLTPVTSIRPTQDPSAVTSSPRRLKSRTTATTNTSSGSNSSSRGSSGSNTDDLASLTALQQACAPRSSVGGGAGSSGLDDDDSIDARLARVCGALKAAQLHWDDCVLDPPELDLQYVDASVEAMLARMAGCFGKLIDFVRASELRNNNRYRSTISAGSMSRNSSGGASIDTDVGVTEGATATLLRSFTSELLPLAQSSLVMDLVMRKLSAAGFLSLRTDEQLVLTGLVERAMCLLCTLTIVSPAPDSCSAQGGASGAQVVEGRRQDDGGDAGDSSLALTTLAREHGAADQENRRLLDAVLDVLVAVERLWAAVRVHVDKIPESRFKFVAMRHMMQCTSTGIRIDPNKRKLVEKETAQVRKVLETAVMVREMLAEVRGSVYAIKRMRLSLLAVPLPVASEVKSGPVAGENPALTATACGYDDEDMWEKAEEEEDNTDDSVDMDTSSHGKRVGSGVGAVAGVKARKWPVVVVSVETREHDFLEEYNSLERGLDALMGRV